MVPRKITTAIAMVLLVMLAVGLKLGINVAVAVDGEEGFTTDFRLEDCKFKAKAKNPYFSLEPGYQLVLEGEDDEAALRLVITVLNDTKQINLNGIGQIKTRVIEEREWEDDELVEVSRNFFARCEQTNAIYYFGEEVDIYEDGEIVSHDGAWQAGEGGALPGLIMPGTFLLGSRYFQEIALEVALDRAEHVAMGLQIEVPAGNFGRCVEVLETTPLEPGSQSVKRYCPGVGLVFDDGVELVNYGFDIVDPDEEEGDEEPEDGQEEEGGEEEEDGEKD